MDYKWLEEARGYFGALGPDEALGAYTLSGLLKCSQEEAWQVISHLLSTRDIEHAIDENGRQLDGLFEARTRYKGWDYMEIIDKLGLPDPEGLGPDVMETQYSKKVWALFSTGFTSGHPTDRDKETLEEMRDFLTALVSEGYKYDTHAPLLAGILAIKDDVSFVQAFAQNLGLMWN